MESGLAVGLLQLVQLNPPGGLHVYVVAPLAVSATESPGHIPGEPGVTVRDGDGITVMVMDAESVQPFPFAPITVYVVVAVGVAITCTPVVTLSPVAGVQV